MNIKVDKEEENKYCTFWLKNALNFFFFSFFKILWENQILNPILWIGPSHELGVPLHAYKARLVQPFSNLMCHEWNGRKARSHISEVSKIDFRQCLHSHAVPLHLIMYTRRQCHMNQAILEKRKGNPKKKSRQIDGAVRSSL